MRIRPSAPSRTTAPAAGQPGNHSSKWLFRPLPSAASLSAASVAVLATLALAGCAAAGSNSVPPGRAETPAAFRNAPAATPSPNASTAVTNQGGPGSLERWWDAFGDPELDRLLRTALACNASLDAVASRVAEARARMGIARADAMPHIAATGGSRLAGESSERTLPLPGSPISYRDSGDTYRLSFEAGYELDLWGRVAKARESAGSQFQATLADQRAAMLGLTAEVATAYFNLRGLELERKTVLASLNCRRQAVSLLRTRVEAGLVNELDLHRARAEAASLESELADLARRRELLFNALAILTGCAPSEMHLDPGPALPPQPPPVTAGMPASVIARRPDIAAAEETLRARLSEIGAAEAARYPSISLTGNAGVESAGLGDLMGRPAQFWAIGPSISVPILDGGRIDANVQAARARAEGAQAEHRQRVLQALREVEDALVDLTQQREQAQALDHAHASTQLALDLTQARYRHGLVSYVEVLDAERNLLQFERSLAQLQASRLVATTRLIRALGGSL